MAIKLLLEVTRNDLEDGRSLNPPSFECHDLVDHLVVALWHATLTLFVCTFIAFVTYNNVKFLVSTKSVSESLTIPIQ